MTRRDDPRFTDPAPRIHSTARTKDCRLGRFSAIGERTVLRDVEVGDYSYFERNCEAIYTRIGKFCSIAADCRINALEHPVERVTSHKISYRPNEYFRFKGVDRTWREYRQQKKVVIGNDVWIGHGAVIMPGVSIGDGAVIGANAVVTRDVGPYEIMAGVPARLLRKRFDAPIAARLQAMKWWDWNQDRLFEAIDDMQTLDIGAFLDKWEARA
ncbi:MAG: DapH/DapD/GlmU-related protein [Rhizobiaceae bacterium]